MPFLLAKIAERCIWASRVVLNVPLRIKVVGFDAEPFVDHPNSPSRGVKAIERKLEPCP